MPLSKAGAVPDLPKSVTLQRATQAYESIHVFALADRDELVLEIHLCGVVPHAGAAEIDVVEYAAATRQ